MKEPKDITRTQYRDGDTVITVEVENSIRVFRWRMIADSHNGPVVEGKWSMLYALEYELEAYGKTYSMVTDYWGGDPAPEFVPYVKTIEVLTHV